MPVNALARAQAIGRLDVADATGTVSSMAHHDARVGAKGLL